MDGIELIRCLKQRDPGMKAIILSCHDEFTYAQQAIKLQVSEYVIKETMKKQQLEEMLTRVAEELQKERRSTLESERMKRFADRHRSAAKEQFLQETLQRNVWNEGHWQEELASFGIVLEKQPYLLFYGFANSQRMVGSDKPVKLDETFAFAVENVWEEWMIQKALQGVVFRFTQGSWLAAVPVQRGIKTNPYAQAAEMCRELQMLLKTFVRATFTFIVGDVADSGEQLRSAMQNLILDRPAYFYTPSGAVMKASELSRSFSQEDLFDHYGIAFQEWTQLLMEEAEERISPLVDKWMELFESKRYHPETVREWSLKLFLDLHIRLRTREISRESYSKEKLHSTIHRIEQLEELRQWAVAYLIAAIPRLRVINQMSKRVEIKEAQRYVVQNMHRKITLEEVAELLHLHPNYFSRFFKKEMGETFVEYVTRMRMERAKELLAETNMTSDEVCESLGYESKSYFNKVFRIQYGVSPSEWLGKMRS